MNRLLVPAALAAASTPVLAQARLDAQLLFPTDWIAPRAYTADVCPDRQLVPAGGLADLSPRHQLMLLDLARRARAGDELPHACWLPPVPNATMALWNAVMQNQGNDFNPETRWSQTATQGGGLLYGDPTVITYSFVPDGTTIPGAVGQPNAPSELFTSFNGAFPSQQTWQQRVADALARWGQLAGVTFVFEPNDDGAPFPGSGGQLGVRGDVRIAAVPVDGSSGILAYNYFPNTGDMVLDSADTGFYANPANNYVRLFNVIGHEEGHGIGIAHVCPTDNTKLMEPFLNVNFSGPQFDDILSGQRLYGDPFEHNDTAATATDLGPLGNGTDTTTLVSVDGDTDVDWYRFTLAGPKQVDLTVRPAGTPYLEGDQNQNGSCQAGVLFDPTLLRDLAVELIASDGVTVLASADQQPAGGDEVTPSVLVPAGGDYYVRVFGGPIDQVQLYELDVTIGDGPPFTIEVVGGTPASVPSGAPAPVDVRVLPGVGSADPNTGTLFASLDGGPFVPTPLAPLGGNDYRGLLPAGACFDTIDWYVSFQPLGGGGAVTEPLNAPAGTLRTEVLDLPLVAVFSDDFETNQGWSVVNDAALTDGAWDRGVPVGGGDRGDPALDGDGSGACYLTDNVDGNSDVDGGATSLVSPLFDLSGYDEARITWLYWYTNDFGSNPGQDVWLTEISDDGGASWVTVQSTTASTGDWTGRALLVSDFVALTDQVRMRFTASDPPPGAVVEAGVDGFRVEVCSPAPIALLPGACGGAFGASTIALGQTALAGAATSVECSAVPTSSGPVFLGVVLGFTPTGATLPSCGCVVHPSLDLIDLQLANWSAATATSWSLPLNLPAGTAGQTFYVQGLAATPAGTCSEAGLPLNLTDALRVTVQ